MNMNTALQKGQKVLTPEGEGLIEDVIGDEIKVRLNSGDIKSFSAEQIEDDSDQG
jgi:preprotein translocase subunit YajC